VKSLISRIFTYRRFNGSILIILLHSGPGVEWINPISSERLLVYSKTFRIIPYHCSSFVKCLKNAIDEMSPLRIYTNSRMWSQLRKIRAPFSSLRQPQLSQASTGQLHWTRIGLPRCRTGSEYTVPFIHRLMMGRIAWAGLSEKLEPRFRTLSWILESCHIAFMLFWNHTMADYRWLGKFGFFLQSHVPWVNSISSIIGRFAVLTV